MPINNVSPTRMELSNQKKRLKTASRGHKLLKDKQDELVKKFIELIKINQSLRIEVENELNSAFSDFVVARALMSEPAVENALSFPVQTADVKISKKNIMSVNTPVFKLTINSIDNNLPYGLAQTSAQLDFAVRKIRQVIEKMVKLAEVEKSCQLMAEEIVKTRRRVNALEYVMIPNFQETIRVIKMKLDEADRSTRINLMKIKSMVQKTN
ncbi:MAG: V-type ATP synthase subunit D [Clostridiales bacterium GWF2_38_85]|nr:MAG: V-type ATP synthase subunit D [Clostridiales bacterium GWF2_38_85]HBL83497.1 V-type ATP synthase subunit D [Clostridiales bacterium]